MKRELSDVEKAFLASKQRLHDAAVTEQRSPAAATPLRPAEEIAREMVRTWARSNDIGLKITLEIRDGTGRAFVDVETEGEVDDMRALITRLIEQSRAEGAAAERERVDACIGDAHAALHELEQQAGPGRALHEAVSRAHEALHRTACAMPAAQPATLADAIRALIQDYAGRWADAESISRPDADALYEALRRLVEAQRTARLGRDVAWCVDNLRDIARANRRPEVFRQAASDLEAIVALQGGAK